MSEVVLAECTSPRVPDPVAYAAIVPDAAAAASPVPLCVLLHGGGADRRFLVELQPLLDALWADGSLPPLVFATPTTGEMSFYLDDPDGGAQWESFVAEDFPAHLRDSFPVRGDAAGTVLAGASMGGYGALKAAFRRPAGFAAVAALEPAIEPALRPEDCGPRNRFFYPAGVQERLIGADRDPALWAANNPATLARDHAAAIRDAGLPIYLEVGSADAMNLQDGAEFLHRVLWEQQIDHEYHLYRGADHVGPSLAPRLRALFAWIAATLAGRERSSRAALSPEGRAWIAWLDGGFAGPAPPPVDLGTAEGIAVLRHQLAPARAAAAAADPRVKRRFGALPPTD